MNIIIVGTGETAEIAYEYFTHDSNHAVVAFAVDKQFLYTDQLYGLPVVDFEAVEQLYPPSVYGAFVAASSTHLNRVRSEMFHRTKAKGYQCVSYVSSKAFVWRNVEIGENCIIFEGNVIQRNVKIGNNVILWSGNHIGHGTAVGDHVFVTSHAVVSGFCTIGEYSFLGVNCCIADGLSIAKDTVIGMGAVVPKSINNIGTAVIGNPAKPMNKSAYQVFSVPTAEQQWGS